MTKYYSAKVDVVKTKTVFVQVAGDSEADALEQAREKVRAKEPGFTPNNIQLTFIGESEMVVGSRVVHSIFGAGAVEALTPYHGVRNGFSVQVKFDQGDTKTIDGRGGHLRPESLVNPEG